MSDTFKCSGCGETKAINQSGGTGYAICADKRKICYTCCGEIDRKAIETGTHATLYLVKRGGEKRENKTNDPTLSRSPNAWVVCNWPGTMEFKVQTYKHGSHNIAKTRTDCWFQDHTGKAWWGVSYGENTQIIHCRKLK